MVLVHLKLFVKKSALIQSVSTTPPTLLGPNNLIALPLSLPVALQITLVLVDLVLRKSRQPGDSINVI